MVSLMIRRIAAAGGLHLLENGYSFRVVPDSNGNAYHILQRNENGNENVRYKLYVDQEKCGCFYYAHRGVCKHLVALFQFLQRKPQTFTKKTPFAYHGNSRKGRRAKAKRALIVQ